MGTFSLAHIVHYDNYPMIVDWAEQNWRAAARRREGQGGSDRTRDRRRGICWGKTLVGCRGAGGYTHRQNGNHFPVHASSNPFCLFSYTSQNESIPKLVRFRNP